MTIIYISDFDLRGSGYMNLSVKLCDHLSRRGYDIIALGLGYNGQQHPHDFKIVPASGVHQLVPMVNNLRKELDVKAVVVALDVPLQEKILADLGSPLTDLPYVGLFPLEAPPVCGPWAMSLLRMDARLVMSKFGQQALADKMVDSGFIPIGIDIKSWRPPAVEERQTLRTNLGVEDDITVILTVADNQERKNLSRSMEIVADFMQDRKAVYWLVTRPQSPVGWKLEDYALDLGIVDRVSIWERGLPFRSLWALYAAADVMLLTSKAEGLALPVLEAMACRLPVVGTKCAAIEEHLEEDRGFLIEPDYVMCDPWGNSNRYLAGRDSGVYALKLWRDGVSQADLQGMLDRAQEYVTSRTWERAADVLDQAIQRVTESKMELMAA